MISSVSTHENIFQVLFGLVLGIMGKYLVWEYSTFTYNLNGHIITDAQKMRHSSYDDKVN